MTIFFKNLLIFLVFLVTNMIDFIQSDIYNLNFLINLDEPINNQPTVNSSMSYGRFLEYLDLGWIKEVDIYGDNKNAIVKALSPELGNRLQKIDVEIPVRTAKLIEKLKQANVNFDIHTEVQNQVFIFTLLNLIVPIVFIGLLLIFFQSSEEKSSQSNTFQSPAKFLREPNTGIGFDDIAGIDEAKSELAEIVSFLEETEKYIVMGAKIPAGVLLVGPPGTGKTLLTRALANEASVPFFITSGSEFVEMFIGIGASRIRDLFIQAKENSPCIIFIDEIDAIARERGSGVGGGNEERDQTLNQLLIEMDGFKRNSGVIVIGATNRVDIIDKALLRPGRFSRQITIGLPDKLGRLEILKVHARNKPLAEDVLLERLASRTGGFSGAELANILNEAGLLAVRYKRSSITNEDVNEAFERIIGGLESDSKKDDKAKKLITYHELGHAIVASILQSHEDPEKISILPRGSQKGLTWFIPDENQTFLSRSKMLAQITTLIAGNVAESVIFGNTDTTTGGSDDLLKIRDLIVEFVMRFGFSKIGPMRINFDSNMTPTREISDDLINKMNKEMIEILNYCENLAYQIIEDNRVVIDLLADKLLEVETLDGNEFKELLMQYTKLSIKKV